MEEQNIITPKLGATFIGVVDEQSGTGKTGNTWSKALVQFKTNDKFPKDVVVEFWGDEVKKIKSISNGSELVLHLSVESRLYNDKWFTNVKCWRFDIAGAAQNRAANAAKAAEQGVSAPDDSEDDSQLPF